MKNVDRVARGFRHVGEVSSKYGYCPEQFEIDVQRHIEEGEKLYKDFIEFMKSHAVDPRKFRELFHKYYEEFIEGDVQ